MNMIKWTVIAVLCCFTAGTAFADVSNEVVVGLEGDSTSKVESSTGVDLNDKLETSNSLFTVQYTHFFTPLKDDDKPIDLRRFYQHPSTLSAGLAFIGSTDKDSTVPAAVSDGKGNASMLLLGGEIFLPTNTGFFLNIGGGSGTFRERSAGRPSRTSISSSACSSWAYVSTSARALSFTSGSTVSRRSPPQAANRRTRATGAWLISAPGE
jgi:hypothetical protein